MNKLLTGSLVLLVVGMLNCSAYADAVKIVSGKKVTLDYTLTVDNAQVETSVGKAPLTYVVGNHNIIPGLESQLNGMSVNEEKVITVAPKDAYGEVNPQAYKEFPRTALPKGAELKAGMKLLATAPDGSRIPVEISAVNGDKVTVNFNHPMAGKTLTFKVKILKIEDAPAMSVATK